MSALPPELWTSVFDQLSIAAYVTNSEAESWTRIAGEGSVVKTAYADILKAKYSLSLVSKGFRKLSRPILVEFITLKSVDQIERFAFALLGDSELAITARQHTKRLDVALHTDPRFKDLKALDRSSLSKRHRYSQQVLSALGSILAACPTMKRLTFSMDERFVAGHSDVLAAFSNTSPSLEVLCWNFVYQEMAIPTTTCVIPVFHGLRVLDLSTTERSLQHDTLPVDELPHLHTLVGAFRVICLHFHNVRLPSLRTLGFTEVSVTRHFFSTELFIRNHGENVRSLSLGETDLHDSGLLFFFPNVTELVLQWTAVGFFAGDRRNVTTLGIIAGSDGEQIVAFRALIAHRGAYPELRTVRLLQPAVSCKDSWRFVDTASRNEVKRLEEKGIKVEYGGGNSLFQTCPDL